MNPNKNKNKIFFLRVYFFSAFFSGGGNEGATTAEDFLADGVLLISKERMIC
jgi:hypothetical protein